MSIDLDKIADGVIHAVKGFIAQAVSGLSERIDRLDAAVKDWKSVDVAAIAREAAALVPEPKPGVDGKSIDIEVVRGMVQTEVAAIPRPENGKDADPAAVIAAAKAAIEALPKPADGKDADPEFVKALVADAVAELPRVPTIEDLAPVIAEAVKAIEVPVVSIEKAPEPEEVVRLVRDEVEKQVAAIPPAAAGKDADPTEIAKMVERAVAAIPKPDNGKDVDPELVAKLIAEEVAKIPVPEPGKDADPEQIRSMVNEAVSAIPAPKDGKSVPVEDVQRMVDEAVAKAIAGIVVKDGTPGRDALALDILPMIDVEKSYPRNIYSTHNGGLWRSFETTHGMKGWECIVDGVAGVRVESPSARKCVVIVQRASGVEESKEFTVPGFDDRGVFKEGESYLRGDGVTYGGCLFLAQKDDPSGKPGTSQDWRMAVKKGRDGRDAGPSAPTPTEPVRLK